LDQKQIIHIQVYRSPSPDQEDSLQQGSYKKYEIDYKDRMTVMSVCDYIQQNIDRSLAYYKSCRIGKCTGCIMAVDGKNMLACTTLAKDGMKIGPAKGNSLIRDLLVEL
jgi:succinate dehydrogenase/fumarate reductase-like Fe-S protein